MSNKDEQAICKDVKMVLQHMKSRSSSLTTSETHIKNEIQFLIEWQKF